MIVTNHGGRYYVGDYCLSVALQSGGPRFGPGRLNLSSDEYRDVLTGDEDLILCLLLEIERHEKAAA